MEYRVVIKGQRWRRVKNPPNKRWEAEENWEGYDTTEEGVIVIKSTPNFNYGNGKYMFVKSGFKYLTPDQTGRDIRYDTDYSERDEIGFIRKYIPNWMGDKGWWKDIYEVIIEEV